MDVALPAILQDLLLLGLAYLLALPIGWNREKARHTAGIRTFPIVAMASCALIMVAQDMPGTSPDVVSRILQGLVTGIGFVGGGAILKDKGSTTGTSTAASIWGTGIAGAAVGLRAYHIAIALTVLTFLTLVLFVPIKKELAESDSDEAMSK